ncbi:MAG: alpha/beta fold hydrolase, partial [Thiobacillus sp.]|nr:alpha/beta fold hydrolase [Thiobacillus sp.]
MSLPVVFLHGWGLHGGIWDEAASRLTGFEVHQPDLPGYGEVPTISPYDSAGIADALAPSLPERCIAVGWSMGGMAALAWAGRWLDQVAGLVLVATSQACVNSNRW